MIAALSPSSLELGSELRMAIVTFLDDESDLLARLNEWHLRHPDTPAGLDELLRTLRPVLRDAFDASEWDSALADRLLADLIDCLEELTSPGAGATPSPDFVTSILRLRDACRALLADAGFAEVSALRRLELITDLAMIAAAHVWNRTAIDLYRQRERDALARDHFFSMVNHDLKSPLANIKAQADLLLRRLERGKIPLETEGGRAEIISRLKQIGQRTRELGCQIDDLVDVLRIESQRFSVHLVHQDLTKIVASAVASLRALYADRTLELVLPRGPLWVDVDAVRMTQVINNLVSNAVKYSPPGSPVHVRLVRRDGQACLEVADHGPGIPEEQRPHLFKSYFRGTTPRWGGTGLGLGLYIVAGIVRAHNGTITFQSEVGAGSTFTVCLPHTGN